MILGSMQHWPLLVSRLIDHAAANHGDTPIISLRCEGDRHETTWARVAERARRVGSMLSRLGIRQGDRVATLAWNTHRHLEAWYGIAGMGAVAHTVNPRLFKEQIVYIMNHAEDQALLFDLPFLDLVTELAPHLTTVKHFILLTDAAHMPVSALPNLLSYESLLGEADGSFAWPELDENAPSGLCYTSGTTGNPKGVLYSHRSNVLHALGAGARDAMGLSARSVVLPVVSMYHANAWGLPYVCAATGCKLVMGGPHFDPGTLHKLILDEGVTYTAAVPTVWLGMLQYLEKIGGHLGDLSDVVIGGSAVPRFMIEAFARDYGVTVRQAWGMTEMSPLGTVGTHTARTAALSPEAQLDVLTKQGRAIFGVEMKIVDDAGRDLPRDGKTFGNVLVRGPWIIGQYFKGDGGNVLDAQGWFATGDVGTIDADGFMQITDRSKDVIKSGGEWISSIELENIAAGCPGVAEAAVIGIAHPKWDERPLLIIVRKPEAKVDRADVLNYLVGKIVKWWTPDDVVFVDEIPHTATGKIQKVVLRQQFADYRLPTA
jgi:acyl-CoA synthetase (AMP-forming)/AMP-acid ligase II